MIREAYGKRIQVNMKSASRRRESKLKKLSISYLVPSLNYGGSETLLLTFLKYLDKTKFVPEVHSFYDNGKLVSEFRENGITVFEWNAPRRDPVTFLRMLRFMRRRKYDILHTHIFDWQGRVIALFAGIPVIITTYHLVSDWDLTGNFVRYLKVKLDSLTSRLNDKIIVVGEDVKRSAIQKGKIPAEKIVTVQNGIDVNAFCDSSDGEGIRSELGLNDRRIIIAIGRLVEQKGHTWLIEAANILRKDYPDISVLIVGEGDLKDTLESQIRDNGLEGTVKLLGARRDIQKLLAISELYVMPSLFEGLPITLLEAMAAGKPIVATEVDGIRNVLRNGIEGLIIPPKESEGLAGAISDLLSDRHLAESLAQSSLKKVREDFNIQDHVKRIEEIYLEQATVKGVMK
jgi:glycosyltransferase involved in cell wall biosynthesis